MLNAIIDITVIVKIICLQLYQLIPAAEIYNFDLHKILIYG